MSEKRRRRPTQRDIARHAGVSQATVSLVINGSAEDHQIPSDTRQRVLDAVRDLGYVANPVARSLKGGRTRMLGLYTFEAVFPTDQRDFYHPFLQGVEEQAAECGYDLVLFTSAGAARDRSLFADGANRLKVADGCVLLGRHVKREELARLAEEDFPFVFIGRREIEGAELSYVAADYAAATARVVAELTRLGHRRLLYLKVPGDAEPTRDRLQGFHDGLAEAGQQPAGIHLVSDPAMLSAGQVVRWLGDGVTAFVVEPTEDDRTAAALYGAAQQAGVRVPQDCSVVLLGDPPPWGQQPRRDWTRFTIPREQMGVEAVELLIDLLDGPAATRTLLVQCEFVPGTTAGPAPGPGSSRWSG